MDKETLHATLQEAHGAAGKLIELAAADHGDPADEPTHGKILQMDLDEIAEMLAGALCSVIGLMPTVDEDTNQLADALAKWLP